MECECMTAEEIGYIFRSKRDLLKIMSVDNKLIVVK